MDGGIKTKPPTPATPCGFLILLLALAGLAANARGAPAASQRLVAVVDGFEIRLPEEFRRSSEPDYRLFRAIQDLTLWKSELTNMGADASLKAVKAWREARVAEHQARVAELRELQKHPERARAIYESDAQASKVPFDTWLAWTQHYQTDDQIESWAATIPVGHYRLTLDDRTNWPLWQFLEDMLNEARAKQGAVRHPSAEILKPGDQTVLEDLSVAYLEGVSDNPLRTPAGPQGGSDLIERMRRSLFLGPLDDEMQKIQQYEAVQRAHIELKDRSLENVRDWIARKPPSGRTRAELLAPMTPEQAVGELSIGDGRGVLAYLTLARAGRGALPLLLGGLSSKEDKTRIGCLVLLRYLRSREALEPIYNLSLWKDPANEMADQALATVKALDPLRIPALAKSLVTSFEAQPTYAAVGETFVPDQIKMAFFLLSRGPQGRKDLAPYLRSSKAGVRLQAALELAKLKDHRAYGVAESLLEKARSDYELTPLIKIFVLLDDPKAIPLLDNFARERNSPNAAQAARQIELDHAPPGKRWGKLTQWAQGPNNATTYWAYQQVQLGFQQDIPEAVAAMSEISKNPTSLYSRQASAFLQLRKLKGK